MSYSGPSSPLLSIQNQSLEEAALEFASPKPFRPAPRFDVADDAPAAPAEEAAGFPVRGPGRAASRGPSPLRRGPATADAPEAARPRAPAAKPAAKPPRDPHETKENDGQARERRQLRGSGREPPGEQPAFDQLEYHHVQNDRFGWRRGSLVSRGNSPMLVR